MQTEKFGEFLHNLRNEKGYTQAQLAELLNVTDKAVSKWERGICLPDVSKFEDIADILEVSVTELIKCERNPLEKEAEADDSIVKEIIDISEKDRDKAIRRLTSLFTAVSGALLIIIGAVELIINRGNTQTFTIFGNMGDITSAIGARNLDCNYLILSFGVILLIISVIKSKRKEK